MDVLLVDPPYRSLKGAAPECAYSAGMVALAAWLRRAGFETAVLTGDLLVDAPAVPDLGFDLHRVADGQKSYRAAVEDSSHPAWERVGRLVAQMRPRLVAIAWMTPVGHAVARVVEQVGRVDPEIRVVVGGHHPTFCPDAALHDPAIDFAIRGEGELPLAALADRVARGSTDWDSVPGLCFRRDSQLVCTPRPPPIARLDELPEPARDLVVGCDWNRYPIHYVVTARGCPFDCAFCSDRRLWGGKVRRRSVGSVLAEIESVARTYPVRFVDIVDGTFTYDRAWVRDFCSALAAKRSGIAWRCTARYDSVDEAMLADLKRAGCAGLYFGLESGSADVLRSVGKRTSVAQIVKVSEAVRRAGIPSIASVLLGLPGETREDIRATLDLMRRVPADYFDVNCYSPLPGTRLHDAMSPEERARVDWSRAGYKSFEESFNPSVPRDEMEGYLAEAYAICAGRSG